MKNTFPKLVISVLLLAYLHPAFALASDDATEMQVVITPSSAKIRPLETAVIQVKLFGVKKKKGLLGVLFGGDKDQKQPIDSSDWKIALTTSGGGWLSKPFLFQETGERTNSGFGNFIKQGIGSISAKDSVLYTAPQKPGQYTLRITNKSLSENVSIEVTNSAPSTISAEAVTFRAPAPSSDPYFALVEHYAPFIAQETWFTPAADFLARFDYDGNWKGDDNWENVGKGSTQAFVYYAAMETETHWFLLYNFYHPRDYSDVCIIGTCHENDNEGIILTVRKDESRFGRLEVLETLAHNNVYSFTSDPRIKNGLHNIEGKISLYQNSRPVIFIEAGGHGIYGADWRSSLFSPQTMNFTGNTGITYVYTGTPERPSNANDRNVGYALLPIFEDLWTKGNQDSNQPNETFGDFFSYEPFGGRPKASAKFISGAFRGSTAKENMAKPFWAWHDRRTRDKRFLNTGQWALDPAYAVAISLKFPADKPVSDRYLYNPYLAVSGE